MSIFFNFFLKTLAFFSATTFFIVLLTFFLTFSQNDSLKEKSFTFKEGNKNSKNKIAFMRLKGPIFNEPSSLIEFSIIDNPEIIYVNEIKNDLQKLEFEKIKGLIVSIDSPGGSVSATYNLYKAFQNFKKNNKILVFFHTSELLASGGYWTALSSDKIYADYGALIGSIGVRGPEWIFYDNPLSISTGILGQSVETKNGIKKFNTIAGRSKDLFDPFRIPTQEERENLQDIVNGIYEDFINAVSKNRNVETQFITNDLGASIFDAKKAQANYLIDDVINLKIAKDRLIKELDLSDFQILEKKKTRIGILQKFIYAELSKKNSTNIFSKTEVCNLINSYVSLMFVNSYLKRNC